MEMANLSPGDTREDKNLFRSATRYTDDQSNAGASVLRTETRDGEEVALAERGDQVEYRVYKIRWFGLTQLILLNIIVSWDVSTSNLDTPTHERSMANSPYTVAVLLRRRQHSSGLLLHEPQRHQLAQHRLPIRLPRRSARHDLDSPHRRSPSRNHHLLHPHPPRQLDPLCRHARLPSQIWRNNVRTNPHRPRPTLRSLCAHPLLRPVVHAGWPRIRHSNRIPSQPLRRRPRSTHLPLPRHETLRHPLHDALRRSHLHRRLPPLLLHPRKAPNTSLPLLHPHHALPARNHYPAWPQSNILPHLHPLRHLCRLLQLHLLSPHPNPHPLRLLRRRFRPRRRGANPRRTRQRSHHISNHGSYKSLPPLHKNHRPYNRPIVSSIHMGARNQNNSSTIHHPRRPRSSKFQSRARGIGMACRSHMACGSGGGEHDLLGWRAAFGRSVYSYQ